MGHEETNPSLALSESVPSNDKSLRPIRHHTAVDGRIPLWLSLVQPKRTSFLIPHPSSQRIR